MNIQEKATELSNMFDYITEEKAKEQNKRANIYLVKDEYDNNEELKNLIREAHGDYLPDDFIYEYIVNALKLISECDFDVENEFLIDDLINERIHEIESDCYTSNLTQWLASNNNRVYYLTQALEEFDIKDGFSALGMAQTLEKQDVAWSVKHSLELLCND